MSRTVLLCTLFLFAAGAFAQKNTTATHPIGQFGILAIQDEVLTAPFPLTEGIYAVFHTSDGDFVAKLLDNKAPKTVENFVQLATGTKKWRHPITQAETDKPIFNNTLFYDILKDVRIRGGDPISKGTGSSGYELDMEISDDLAFDAPGMLAMESAGKKSNGCRFFISLSRFPGYKGRYTIFGKVVGGLDVVRTISRKPTRKPTVPLEPTLLNSVEILRIPAGQQTMASFANEGGRRVLNVEKNFTQASAAGTSPAPQQKPDALSPAAAGTTESLQANGKMTSGTAETSGAANQTTVTVQKF